MPRTRRPRVAGSGAWRIQENPQVVACAPDAQSIAIAPTAAAIPTILILRMSMSQHPIVSLALHFPLALKNRPSWARVRSRDLVRCTACAAPLGAEHFQSVITRGHNGLAAAT